jgi:Zn-dependent peptidase ImmA (M78 family)/transcriptional regulator with XRE-family HTH domain
MIGNINTNMIILAREARGLSQADLAEMIGMSATNLSKIERCDIGIQDEVIEAISEKTNFPIQFFRQEGDIVPENLNYRKRTIVAQKLITPIHAQVNIMRKHIHFLTMALHVAKPIVPILEVTETQTPQDIANKLRQLWKVETPIIADLTKLIESTGIVISSFPFGTDRVDSRSILTDDKFPIIFFNKSLLADRQRFTLAYELGQLIMHSNSIVPMHRDVSKEANAFAAAFLMPAKEIMKDFKDGITIPLLGELKRKWKVSMIALLYRADDLGLVTANQKRYILQQFNQLQIRKREPMELDAATEVPKLTKQWVAEYRQKTKLGTVEMAAIFCMYVDEFLDWYG